MKQMLVVIDVRIHRTLQFVWHVWLHSCRHRSRRRLVMLWAMFSTLGPPILAHVTLTCTTYPEWTPFHGKTCSLRAGRCELPQYTTSKGMVWWQRVWDVGLVTKLHRCQHNQASVSCASSWFHGGQGHLKTSLELKGSPAELLMLDYHSR